MASKYKIMVVSNWGKFPLKRQEEERDRFELVFDEGCKEADLLVVLDDITSDRRELKVRVRRKILILLESSALYVPNREYLRQFDRIYTYRRDIDMSTVRYIRNCMPWHLGVKRSKVAAEEIDGWHMDWKALKDLTDEKRKRISIFRTTKSFTAMHALRKKLEEALVKSDISELVDMYGGNGNMVDDKLEGLQGYQYSIAVENDVEDGYVSEKLFDAILAGCCVFYHGTATLEPEIEAMVRRIDVSRPYDSIQIMRDALKENAYDQCKRFVGPAKSRILTDYNLVRTIKIIGDVESTVSGEDRVESTIRRNGEFNIKAKVRRLAKRFVVRNIWA